MKKLMAIMLCLILVASMAGCGGGDDATPSDTSSGTSSETSSEASAETTSETKDRVTLVLNLHMFHYDDEAVAIALDEVQKMDKYSHVDFEIKDKDPDYLTNMPVQVAGGEQLDIIAVPNSINKKKFAESGLVQPIGDLLSEGGYDLEALFGSDAYLSEVDGEAFVVPMVKSQWVLYYNKDIFDAAGLEYPDSRIPMTWDEYKEVAKQLTSGEGGDKVYGALHLTWPMYWYNSAIMALGGGEKFYNDEGLSNIENPAFAEGMKRQYDMMHVDESIPTYADVVMSKTLAPAFMSGNYGMNIAGSWVMAWGTQKATDYPRDWKLGIAPLPVDSGSTLKTWGDLKAFAIPSTSSHPELALDVIMDLARLGGENASLQPHVYRTESSDLFVETAAALADDGITIEDITHVFANPDIQFVTEKVTGKNNIDYETVIKEEVEKYFVEEQDLETTIANIKERGNKVIQK